MSKNSEIILTNSAVDFLKDEIGEGGSTVIANPTITGDEPDLTGLEVDGAKYKVPQGGGSNPDFYYSPGIMFTSEYLFDKSVNKLNIDWKKVSEFLTKQGFDLSLRIGEDISEGSIIYIALRPVNYGTYTLGDVNAFIKIDFMFNGGECTMHVSINDSTDPMDVNIAQGMTLEEAISNCPYTEFQPIQIYYCFDRDFYPYLNSSYVSNAVAMVINGGTEFAIYDIKPINLIEFAKTCIYENPTSS